MKGIFNEKFCYLSILAYCDAIHDDAQQAASSKQQVATVFLFIQTTKTFIF